MSKVKIRYLGNRARKKDTLIPSSGRVWHGRGSVVEVDEAEAEVYLNFPDVFDDGKGELPDPDAELDVAAEPDPVTGEGESDDPPALENEAERFEAIKGAILALNPANSDDFTSAGLPRVRRVEAILGFDVTSEEVAKAHAELNADA